MRITRTNQVTGRTHQLDLAITKHDLLKWICGELILSPGDGEFLTSGMLSHELDSIIAEWEIAEYALEEEEIEGIILLDPEQVEEVLKLIAAYKPERPVRVYKCLSCDERLV